MAVSSFEMSFYISECNPYSGAVKQMRIGGLALRYLRVSTDRRQPFGTVHPSQKANVLAEVEKRGSRKPWTCGLE